MTIPQATGRRIIERQVPVQAFDLCGITLTLEKVASPVPVAGTLLHDNNSNIHRR